MKSFLALAAVAALSSVALAQPGGRGPGGFGGGPTGGPRGGGSEVEQLKAQIRELSAKIDRLSSSRGGPQGRDTRPAPTPPPSRDARPTGGARPSTGGNSEAVARQFDRIIEELKALKTMVAGGSRGGQPGFGGPPMGEHRGPGGEGGRGGERGGEHRGPGGFGGPGGGPGR